MHIVEEIIFHCTKVLMRFKFISQKFRNIPFLMESEIPINTYNVPQS